MLARKSGRVIFLRTTTGSRKPSVFKPFEFSVHTRRRLNAMVPKDSGFSDLSRSSARTESTRTTDTALTATESICRQWALSDVSSIEQGIPLDIVAKAAAGRSPRQLRILETASGLGKRTRQRVDPVLADI